MPTTQVDKMAKMSLDLTIQHLLARDNYLTVAQVMKALLEVYRADYLRECLAEAAGGPYRPDVTFGHRKLASVPAGRDHYQINPGNEAGE